MQQQLLQNPENILLQIAQTNGEVLKELQSIHQTLKKQSARKQPRRVSKVDELVGIVLMKHNDTNRTAASMGRVIGVTGQAVGQCKQWKKYNELKAQGKAQRYQYRLTYTVSENEMDEIDRRIDNEMKEQFSDLFHL
jgi:adenylosuccinate synthase